MSKVFLGVGHGGKDPGAVGYLAEEDLNLNMALACRDYLVANGVEVGMSRTTDENDDLNEEIIECNAFNPDLCVDIHNNAGGGDGAEVFYHHLGGKSKVLAQNIEAEIIAIGQNSRGCKTRLNSKGNADYYGFIRLTKASAVIVEGLFVDNAEDVKIADTLEEQKAFGVAIAKGILKTLGVTPVKTPVQNNSNDSNDKAVDPYTVKIKSDDGFLNVRKQPNTNSDIVTTVKNNEVYTIVAENGKWGKLKSGVGYIHLGFTEKTNKVSTPTYSYYPACDKKYNSLADALKSIEVNNSFSNRKKIAVKNGIRLYVGTATQNNQLLSKLKAGRLLK